MDQLLAPEDLELLSEDELDEYLALLSTPDGWGYTARQQVAEDMSSQVFEVLYGGAAGGGKSEWLLHHAYDLSIKYPRHRTLLLRRTFPELRRSLIDRSQERFDRSKAYYKRAEHTWVFKNGSHIEFGYLDAEGDKYNYQSAEYDFVGFDELTQFPESDYVYLRSRVRTNITKAARGVRPHMAAGSNPGGIGGLWVRQRFIDPMPPQTVLSDNAGGRAFVPAKISDNPFLDESYAEALEGLPEDIRAALRDGNWDVFEGQYFTEFRRDVHVVEPFEIPEWWVRFRAVDYGYANPFCCLWFAVGPDRELYVYREAYRTRLTPPEQAALMMSMSKLPNGRTEKIDYTVCDPSIWTRTGIGDPIAQQYHLAGLSGLRPAMNARIDGWARVREGLRLNEDEKPSIFFFSSCTNLVRTFPALVRSRTNPEDVDTDSEDHAGDTLRYGMMSRSRSSKPPIPPVKTVEERIAAQLREQRQGSRSHPVLGRLR